MKPMSVTYLLSRRQPPATLSIVIPVYNEQEVLPALGDAMIALFPQFPGATEIVLVNDGSSDNTIFELRRLAERDRKFRVISLARNFGHQIAATAGLDAACGEVVVLMDADLQDPPELILEMIAEYEKGYDIVYARRVSREGESVFKRFTAWLFYRLMRSLVHKDLPADVGDFRLTSRRCLDALKSMRETHRFLRGMVSWTGFPQTAVAYKRRRRAAGATKYPPGRMLRFAWTAAISFSPLPLRLSFIAGAALFGIGLIYGGFALTQMFLGIPLVRGWTSLIVLNCLTSGAVMLGIGVVGEYVARIFEQIKGRPLYIVSDRFNYEGTGDAPAEPLKPEGFAAR
jgi:dolichol-phosphate mannosyltransferase